MPARNMLTAAAIPVATLLAAFFAFVGYHKAFARLSELARHAVWTLALPEWAGRIVGWSELLLAAGLLAIWLSAQARLAALSALILIVNQIAAAIVHAGEGETGALPQNAVLIVMLLFVALAARSRAIPAENAA